MLKNTFNKYKINIIVDNINDCIKTLDIITFSDNIPSSSFFESQIIIDNKKKDIVVKEIHKEPIIKKSPVLYNSLLNKYIEIIQNGKIKMFIKNVINAFGILVKSIIMSIFQRVIGIFVPTVLYKISYVI
jgi:hypothetical protein